MYVLVNQKSRCNRRCCVMKLQAKTRKSNLEKQLFTLNFTKATTPAPFHPTHDCGKLPLCRTGYAVSCTCIATRVLARLVHHAYHSLQLMNATKFSGRTQRPDSVQYISILVALMQPPRPHTGEDVRSRRGGDGFSLEADSFP